MTISCNGVFVEEPVRSCSFTYHTCDIEFWLTVKVPMSQTHIRAQHVSGWRVGGATLAMGTVRLYTESMTVDHTEWLAACLESAPCTLEISFVDFEKE